MSKSKQKPEGHRASQRKYVDARRHDPEYRARRAAEQRAYSARNPEKIAAHRIVRTAINRGILVRSAFCARCGVECKTEASHDDYSKPLEVEWLCRLCHAGKDLLGVKRA